VHFIAASLLNQVTIIFKNHFWISPFTIRRKQSFQSHPSNTDSWQPKSNWRHSEYIHL